MHGPRVCDRDDSFVELIAVRESFRNCVKTSDLHQSCDMGPGPLDLAIPFKRTLTGALEN